jgi:HEPN domain-containing protein
VNCFSRGTLTSQLRSTTINLLDIDALTPYAVETRYPGYLEAIPEEEVTEAIELAEEIHEFV